MLLAQAEKTNVHQKNARLHVRIDICQIVKCDQNSQQVLAGVQSLRTREDQTSAGRTEEEYQITQAQCVIRKTGRC